MELLYAFIGAFIICGLLHLTITRPILEELKDIKKELNQLTQKTEEKSKDE